MYDEYRFSKISSMGCINLREIKIYPWSDKGFKDKRCVVNGARDHLKFLRQSLQDLNVYTHYTLYFVHYPLSITFRWGRQYSKHSNIFPLQLGNSTWDSEKTIPGDQTSGKLTAHLLGGYRGFSVLKSEE